MRTFISKKIACTLLISGIAIGAVAQNNAFVRRDTLLKVLPGYSQKMEEFNSLSQKYADEIKSDRERINRKVAELLSAYKPSAEETAESLLGRLSKPDASHYSMMEKEAALVDEKAESYNELLEMHYKQNIQPLLDKLNAEIEKYAVKNKIDMVFIFEEIAPSLAYINKGKDITPAIISIITK
jgi:Skp family chaperone for outer membrane proteins